MNKKRVNQFGIVSIVLGVIAWFVPSVIIKIIIVAFGLSYGIHGVRLKDVKIGLAQLGIIICTLAILLPAFVLMCEYIPAFMSYNQKVKESQIRQETQTEQRMQTEEEIQTE